MSDVDLTTARVFKEYARNTSARWYVLPNGEVLHSRAPGHLEPSIHSERDVETSPYLEETGREPQEAAAKQYDPDVPSSDYWTG